MKGIIYLKEYKQRKLNKTSNKYNEKIYREESKEKELILVSLH